MLSKGLQPLGPLDGWSRQTGTLKVAGGYGNYAS